MKSLIAIAISGGGRSLRNFLEVQHRYSFEVGGIISSSIHCKGNQIAADYQLPLFTGDFTSSAASHELTDDLCKWLQSLQIEWIALAGFLKKFPLLPGFDHRIVNIHPALLPKYAGKGMYGQRVHDAVFAAKDPLTGATIHFVTDRYDEGPPIAQIQVLVQDAKSASEIAHRVFEAECLLYPEVIEGLIKGRLPVNNEIFRIFASNRENQNG